MTITTLLLFILFVQIVHFLGTWKLYVKAGRKAWEAVIPVYNAVVLMKIINRSPWWTILLFIPIVNLIMFPVVWVETLRSFGKNSNLDTFLGVATFGFYIYYINYTQDLKYIENRSLKPRTSAGEWTSSILFAVVAATIVHTYVMQPFTIPTSSLEKSLLVGDFLFVSKFHYGARAPMSAVSFPMVHDKVPGLNKKSYLDAPQLPFFRFPGFQKIKRNDIVVFSWPTDTLVVIDDPSKGFMYKPIDKKSNYVKRCVGIPGDELEIKDGYVFINGKQNELPDRAKPQFTYQVNSKIALVKTNSQRKYTRIPSDYMLSRYDISDIVLYDIDKKNKMYIHYAQLTDDAFEQLKNDPNVIKIIKNKGEKGKWDPNVFPQNPRFNWNTKYFGPITLPEKGTTIPITIENIPLYKRIIEVYDGSELGIKNKITQAGTQVFLNGELITEYTFLQDYYWMMGDNRDNSQDARMWGFVPFNHVVGKPVFIWMSWDSNNGKVRWERLFTTVGGDGEPVSYFKYFVVLLGAWFAFSYFRKRKKKA